MTSTEPSEGTSSSSDTDRMAATESAVNILAQGKRNMVCGEIPTAVNQFQEACKILAKAYGETAKECADAYFCYGQALLDLARMENGVLGNALQGVPDTDEEESSEKSDQFEKVEMEGEGSEGKSEDGEKTSEEGEKEGEEDGEESMEDEEGTEGEDTADDVSQDESPDAENPDDVSNLQLAWEMLELAKLIYAKDESKEARLRTAEAHLKLGEVSMETEQYEEAVKDFTECLTIQKDILEADNRLLAETYYQLGLAHCFAKKFDDSVSSYKDAIKCIESRITKLDEVLAKATTEEKESKDFDSPVYKAKKEVDDLKELLPDIKSKIDDCEDERKNMDQLKNLAKEALGGLSSSSAPAGEKSEQKPAQDDVKTTDISHLVKRKRKSEDNAEDSTKKPRQEDGAGDAPPVTNGHAQKDEAQTKS